MLYFLKENSVHTSEGEYKRNFDWFVRKGDKFMWLGLVESTLNDSHLQKSVNPEFPTETAKLFRLNLTYPGSPQQNSLFMQSWKDAKNGIVGTYVWKGVWVELKWGNVMCANWENFEKVNFQ